VANYNLLGAFAKLHLIFEKLYHAFYQ